MDNQQQLVLKELLGKMSAEELLGMLTPSQKIGAFTKLQDFRNDPEYIKERIATANDLFGQLTTVYEELGKTLKTNKDENGLVVSFKVKGAKIPRIKPSQQLTVAELKDYLKNTESFTPSDVRTKFADKDATQTIKDLVAEGFIKKEGAGRSTKYVRTKKKL